MKKAVLLPLLLCFLSSVNFAQKRITLDKPTVIKTLPPQAFKEVPDADWKNLIDAVQVENWEKSVPLANQYLAQLKIENDKKQIARLRYILLYSLAGKIVKESLGNKSSNQAQTRTELEKTANEFLGKEFFMPSREISRDCEGKLNYICRSTQQPNILRVTATDHAGTAIYSFEYIRLKEYFNFLRNVGKEVILSGTLKKIEFNPNQSNVWIMRLIFENGTVNVVPD